jgi:hypothetical protein
VLPTTPIRARNGPLLRSYSLDRGSRLLEGDLARPEGKR